MTRDEWTIIAGLIDEWWPAKFDEGASAAWFVALDGYDAEQVTAALKGLLARGGTFRPSVAELVAQIRRDPSTPTFDEALVLVKRALRAWNLPCTGSYGSEAEMLRVRKRNVLDLASGMHPLVAAFVDRYGVERLLKDVGEIGDDVWGGARRAQLRESWDEHCDALEGREIHALTAPRRGGMARLDPLAALGSMPPRQINSGTGA